MKRSLVAPALGLVVSVSSWAQAADFHVDPAAGAATGDGSAAKPWKTLEEVIGAGHFGKAIKAGDTVHLKTGYHGEALFNGGSYAPPISVEADAGQSPKLRHVRFSNTSGWVLRNVFVSPSFGTASGSITMVEVQTSSSKVTIEGCDLFTVPDASAWGAPEWLAASSGISLRGADSVARNNKVKNVRFGITADASKVLVEGNSIVNFSADGLRGLGDDETFQYNLIKNSYLDDSVDSNHDDGFQSWSVGGGGVGTGEVKNMTLRGNVFIGNEDPAQKLKGTMQGIGCFDGTFTGWVVENNVVITNHWHGISLYGAKDSRVVNNTVMDTDAVKPGPPWIMVTAHKNGTPSQNVVVRNNLATDFDVKGTNVTEDHNVTLTGGTLATYFLSPTAPKWDLRLTKTSPAIDKGVKDLAPALDADKIARPQGAGFDLGAYEWHDPSVVPTGGTGGGGGTGGSASGGTAGSAAGGGTAGSAGAAGNASGGMPATGGSGSGGAAGKAGGDGGDDDGGCGCRVPSRSSGRDLGLLGAALLVLLAARRRR
ncbi:MAG: right-handed parallel beta-helix repeat-containing protein [Myxococcales bacterium]|nr:right-handed parallel beta-helix repeat-containing protein [Myxococcales bacterium]